MGLFLNLGSPCGVAQQAEGLAGHFLLKKGWDPGVEVPENQPEVDLWQGTDPQTGPWYLDWLENDSQEHLGQATVWG